MIYYRRVLINRDLRINGQLEKITEPPSQRVAQQVSGGCQRPTAIYTVEI